jgi:hypothetical protein
MTPLPHETEHVVQFDQIPHTQSLSGLLPKQAFLSSSFVPLKHGALSVTELCSHETDILSGVNTCLIRVFNPEHELWQSDHSPQGAREQLGFAQGGCETFASRVQDWYSFWLPDAGFPQAVGFICWNRLRLR